jgi:esterase/lipase superfamily enzyme
VVKLIGSRLIEGQPITDTRIGLGEKVMQVTAGTAHAVGSVAGLAISAPVAIVDPHTRRNFADKTDAVGQSLRDVGDHATSE